AGPQLECLAVANLCQSSASRRAALCGDRRQGRHHPRSDRRGDRRVRGLERGARLSVAERHLAARHPARFRRAACIIRAGDIRLCAGRHGRENDVVVAAASAGASLKPSHSDIARKVETTMSDQKTVPPMPGMANLEEVLLQSDEIPGPVKSLSGVSEKMLWRDDKAGSSIALIKFDAGAGIPQPHLHASNQFMFCLKGRYEYT